MDRLATISVAAVIGVFAWSEARAESATLFEPRTVRAAIHMAFDNAMADVNFGGIEPDIDGLRTIYAANDFMPFWVAQEDSAADTDALLDLFARAETEGLRPNDYFGDEIRHLLGDTTLMGQVASDLMLSAAVAQFGSDIHRGRLAPRQLSADFDFDRRTMSLSALVADVAGAGDPAQTLLSYAPQHEGYVQAREILAEMRLAALAGGWPQVENHGTLRPGEVSGAVPSLRARLAATGELASAEPPADVDPTLYDEALVAAVERFQASHGLAVDGVIGPQTYASLNATVDQRIAQIIATMERWRWIPPDLGGRFILVNIPDYELLLVDGGTEVRRMDVIVGRPDRPTPLFSSALTYLEFNPTWTVPTSIAVNDFLPRLMQDPTYLRQQGIRLYSDWSAGRVELASEYIDWTSIGTGIRSFMLRQDPGPGNSLGRVKFMMDNNFSVYLHDTPARSLFYRSARAFSSGCVRLADPMWLADYLLAGTGSWSTGRRDGILAGGQTTRVSMAQPMPLHLAYITAWRGEDGTVQYREDVYGVDRLVGDALAAIRPERIEIALAD